MTQQLRVFTAPAEDLISSPSTQDKQLTTSCNSSRKGSDVLFWPPSTPILMATHNFKTQHFKRLSQVSRGKGGLHP